MPKHSARAFRSPPAMPLDPDDLTLAIEVELAALAAIDADYAEELQRLEHGAGPTRVKQHRAKQIEALHEFVARIVRLAWRDGWRRRTTPSVTLDP